MCFISTISKGFIEVYMFFFVCFYRFRGKSDLAPILKDSCASLPLLLKALLEFACFLVCFYGFRGKSDLAHSLKDICALSPLFLKALLNLLVDRKRMSKEWN